MSPRLPRPSGAEAVRALEHAAFATVSQRGRHRKLRHRDGGVVVVSMHRELAVGTLASSLPQAGVSPGELAELL